ncbi:hypothetical protein LNQ52_28675 [Klebsiella pneumoniae subsp. pneumoniae]|nr:hypothetical protein [Klebsiella pneumoniae subsp. pneumoniae]
MTGGRQRALSIIARRRFASPGERFRVHILHVGKNGFPARTARRRSLSSIAAAVRVYPPHRDFH